MSVQQHLKFAAVARLAEPSAAAAGSGCASVEYKRLKRIWLISHLGYREFRIPNVRNGSELTAAVACAKTSFGPAISIFHDLAFLTVTRFWVLRSLRGDQHSVSTLVIVLSAAATRNRVRETLMGGGVYAQDMQYAYFKSSCP